VRWRPVAWGVALQLVLGLLILNPALQGFFFDVVDSAVRRLLSAAPFILKGDGWYVTDYPSKSRKKALESEKSASSAATPSGDKSASGDRSAGDKSASGEKSAPPATGSTTSTPSSSASSSPAPSGD